MRYPETAGCAPRGPADSALHIRRLRPPIFCRFLLRHERLARDFLFRSLDCRFHPANDVIRQVPVAAIASAFAPMPAILADPAPPRTLIRRDTNARRTRG
ncbi:hypothetical protein P355_2765 [Burkholderia cenocepacia KC-01]|nr:hypothetical protein P355_2765 [Burkholderia cenocepacia KC-01]